MTTLRRSRSRRCHCAAPRRTRHRALRWGARPARARPPNSHHGSGQPTQHPDRHGSRLPRLRLSGASGYRTASNQRPSRRPGGHVRISLGDVSLWFDVSGPSVIPQGDTTVERPVLVAVHGGPGLDHLTVKSALGPLAEDFQVVYFDLRGHGRSEHSSAEFWNMRTWADDLRRLCDALGLRKPIVLGSSFGGFVALTYAALFPDHPGGVILASTTGGHHDQQRVIEAFGRLGGPEAAAVAQRTYADETGDSRAEFLRVCYPLYSGTPGWAEESRQLQARMIQNMDVALHSSTQEVHAFDPWSVIGAVRCPVLVLVGEDDPICPLPVVEELAGQLPAETPRLVRLPGARHTIFRDRPDLAFPAVRNFVSQVWESQPASC